MARQKARPSRALLNSGHLEKVTPRGGGSFRSQCMLRTLVQSLRIHKQANTAMFTNRQWTSRAGEGSAPGGGCMHPLPLSA